MSSTGATSQDRTWKQKEQADEAQYIHQKEQAQLKAIRESLSQKEDGGKAPSEPVSTHPMDKDFEGGFGGQEDLEDRYATTSGEH